jgi:excisionase family DNA binding protein
MTVELSLPGPKEVESAELIDKELSSLIEMEGGHEIMLVFRKGGKDVELPFPSLALNLLMRIMEQMALGNCVKLMPIHAELTTQEAADILNVSRPYVVKLLEKEEIPFHKVGSHRRIKLEDLMGYKEKMLSESKKARERLAILSQKEVDD